MKRNLQPFGDLEQLVMDIVWQEGCATVRCVFTQINQQRAIAYTTVMTTMDRLSKKGVLKRVKVGKAYEYRACKSRERLNSHEAKEIIHSLIKNYGDVALAQFVDIVDTIDTKKVQQLKKTLRKHNSSDC